jgi:large subunit ribosomal protein L15
VPLYRKLPIRGFTRGTFAKERAQVTLAVIEENFNDGEAVTRASLREKGLIPRRIPGGIKILANGVLTKKVTIEANRYSASAEQKLQELGITFTKV